MTVMTPGVILLSQDEEVEILSIAVSQYDRFEQEQKIQLRDEFANALFAKMVIWKHESRRNELLAAGLESGELCVLPNPEKVDSLVSISDTDFQIRVHPLFSEKYTDIVDYIIKAAEANYGKEYVQFEFGN